MYFLVGVSMIIYEIFKARIYTCAPTVIFNILYYTNVHNKIFVEINMGYDSHRFIK